MTDIEALDRAVAEANAKVAELTAKHFSPRGETYFNALGEALQAREAALAARADAEKPKLLTADRAWAVYYNTDAHNCHGIAMTQMGNVLSAAHERAFRVIEALPTVWETGYGRKHAPLSDIRTALGVKP